MNRTNTKNVNNKLSVFKARLGANNAAFTIPKTVLDNYIFYT